MNQIEVTGMILISGPIGEHDRRVEILTKERGRISAFAKGARRQNSPLVSVANPFVFGTFTLYAGRNSYTLLSAKVENYFAELRMDIEGAYYGMYFLEVCQYFTREGNDETQMLKLLYQSLRALMKVQIPRALVKVVFELKATVIQGEGIQVFECISCGKKDWNDISKEVILRIDKSGILCARCVKQVPYFSSVELDESTLYAMQFITYTNVEKLYTFTVEDYVLEKLQRAMKLYMEVHIDRNFKTLEFLELLV